jgi:hypothetical protein
LTGRKRIAFESIVHKIAIFSDELENVKQLNTSFQQFESNNIEFEKKCFDLHNCRDSSGKFMLYEIIKLGLSSGSM